MLIQELSPTQRGEKNRKSQRWRICWRPQMLVHSVFWKSHPEVFLQGKKWILKWSRTAFLNNIIVLLFLLTDLLPNNQIICVHLMVPAMGLGWALEMQLVRVLHPPLFIWAEGNYMFIFRVCKIFLLFVALISFFLNYFYSSVLYFQPFLS